MPSSQRPFFLSTFFASFRQTTPSISQQPNKHTSQTAAAASASYATQSQSQSAASSSTSPSSTAGPRSITSNAHTSARSGSVVNQLPLHSPRGAAAAAGSPHGMPIPSPGRRRGSDSSSEGFRDVMGADKWYVGGRTAGGEERFFKLGVVRRVRSNDGLSLDRLSL